MTKDEATKQIEDLKKVAYDAIRQAEQIATDNDVRFSFDVAYGMGGWFGSGDWEASSQSC